MLELQDIVDSNDRVVVDFGAPAWCVPCRRLAPHFEKAAEQVDFPFVEVDIDEAPDIREAMGIQSVPTVFLFEGGQYAKTIVGRTVVQIINELK